MVAKAHRPAGYPVANVAPLKQQAGGGMQGAERLSRETLNWNPSIRSPDQVINNAKVRADARGFDMVRNDGYAMGVVATHRDSIVGSSYRLNAKPNWRVLKATEAWAEQFQEAVEARFNLVADSAAHWLDASGQMSFTDMVRLAVGGFCITGEVLATAEWSTDKRRPLKTMVQMISPTRLCNQNNVSDTRTLRRGIVKDQFGKPLFAHIMKGHPGEPYDSLINEWAIVPFEKPWGRKQVIHIMERLAPDQSRGVSDMVAVLKQMKMTKNLQEITLQKAVIQASYAATIESDLPPEVVFAQLGGGQGQEASGYEAALALFMETAGKYYGNANNVSVDGSKIPHLLPGTKLNVNPLGNSETIGSNFEESLLRNIAASLGISYEEFSKDFSKVSYSSARASMLTTWRSMLSKKKIVADRFANEVYSLWLEEEINAGNIPMPPGRGASDFYEPLHRDAYCGAAWIGASRGQIDELKETQAALMRLKGGLSTYEDEIARFGGDWRDVFAQRAREEGVINKAGLGFSLDAQKSGNKEPQNTMSGDSADDGEEATPSKTKKQKEAA